jgi:hypothetical protein
MLFACVILNGESIGNNQTQSTLQLQVLEDLSGRTCCPLNLYGLHVIPPLFTCRRRLVPHRQVVPGN